MSGPAATLEAQGVSVRLGGRLVLDAVSATLEPGEVTALVGANGAGKSTLVGCLTGLRRPDAGTVMLGGAALATLGDRERARRIGLLPQTAEIVWRLDVETLVGLGRTPHAGAFGPSPADRAAVDRALADTDLAGLRTRDVATLSGGERGRALIARALAGEPQWLLADEPLTGLDLAHQWDVAALLRTFARGGGGVVVAVHDLAFAARVADRALVMADGRILADAPPVEALSPAVLAQAYGVDARWIEGAQGPVLDVIGRHG